MNFADSGNNVNYREMGQDKAVMRDRERWGCSRKYEGMMSFLEEWGCYVVWGMCYGIEW